MASKPRTPRNTLNLRPLPKVGDRIMIEVAVTRVEGETITVQIPANGQRVTAEAVNLLKQEE